MLKDKSVLFICYYFPPISSIAIWRNYFLASEAKKIFNKVFVFTTTNHRFFPNEELDLSDFIITNLLTYDYRSFVIKSENKINYSEKAKSGFLTQLGIKLLNSFPISFLIGEGGLVYIWSGYIKGKNLIKTTGITHLYSSYRTMADHFIAYFLKRKFAHFHWTADFRDLPFDQLYKNYVFRDLQKWLLRKLLTKADLITTFSKGLATGLKDYTSKEIQILPNGFFQPLSKKDAFKLNDKFTIQYTGSLFLEERNPGVLFKAINELIQEGLIDPDNFVIQYAGKDGNKWLDYIRKHDLENVSIDLGMLAANKANELQSSAHINLLLSSSHAEYQGIFTGKFFEYISAGRPILAILKGVKDLEFENVFDKYNLGLLSYSNNEGLKFIKEYISIAYKEWSQTGSYKWTVSPIIKKDFNWDNTAKMWSELIS